MTYAYDALGRRTSAPPPRPHHHLHLRRRRQPHRPRHGGHTLAFDHDAAGQERTRTVGDNLTLTQTLGPPRPLSPPNRSPGARAPRTPQSRPPSPTPTAPTATSPRSTTPSRRRTLRPRPAGRVTAVHATDWTETYAYDEAGNQTHATWPDHPHRPLKPRATAPTPAPASPARATSATNTTPSAA